MRLIMYCYGYSVLSNDKSLSFGYSEAWYYLDEDPEESKTLGVRLCL